MPRKKSVQKSGPMKLREYARNQRKITSYDVAYHLVLAALAADGQTGSNLDPDAPALSDLSAAQKTEYDAALAAMSAAGEG